MIPQRFDQRLDAILAGDTPIVAMPGAYDIGGGDSAGWGRGCDGPLWLPEFNALSFSDVGHRRRLIWSPGDKVQLLAEQTGAAIGVARDPDGAVLACEWETRRLTRTLPDGTLSVLVDNIDGRALNRPDDVVISATGAIFFTDLRIAFPPPDPVAIPHSGTYRLSPALGAVQRIAVEVAHPGGLALSPNEDVLYVSDTRERRLLAYDLGAGSAPGPGRVLANLEGSEAGAPHGLAVDQNGNVYCGGPGGVWILTSTGERLGVLPLPVSRVTNLAFGGADGRTLFMTSPVGVAAVQTGVGVKPHQPSARTAGSHPRGLKLQQGVERHDPALDRIIDPEAVIANLACGGFLEDIGGGPDELYSRSLEGTIWSADENCLYFSDIGNSRRLRWDPEGRLSVVHQPTGNTNGAAFDLQGRILSCEHSGRRVSRREHDGSTTVILDRFEGRRLNHPNDVVVRSDGSIFFTDPWWDFGAGDVSETGHTGVYQVSPDLKTVTLIANDFVVPNGLTFSPDEKTLYVNDTFRFHVRAFDVRPDGSVDTKSDRIFCDLSGDRHGKPDGMKVDQAGNVYCGGAGGLWVLDPAGRHLGTIVHGATQTNNLTFGAADWRMLFFVSWISLHSIPVLIPGMPPPGARSRR